MSLFSSLMASQEPKLLQWFSAGDIGTFLFTEADLTMDGADHVLDLSTLYAFQDGVTPVMLLLRVLVKDSSAGKIVAFGAPDVVNDTNVASVVNQVTNIYMPADVWVEVKNKKIMYNVSATTEEIDVILGGYLALA